MKIKKAVIPAAGLGSRMLPSTKAVPKEMINVVKKPAIQYIVEEAVASGIEESNYDAALSEIMAQFEAVRSGDFDDDEFDTSKKYVISALHTMGDSQYQQEDFWLGQSIAGLEYSLEDLAELIGQVSREDVIAVGQGITPDSVYLLSGRSDSDE